MTIKMMRVTARVSDEEHARFIALGGSEWLRKVLAEDHDAEMAKAREAWDGSCDWVAFRNGWLASAKGRV